MEVPDVVLRRLGLEVAQNQVLAEENVRLQEEVKRLSDALEGQSLSLAPPPPPKAPDAETA